MPVSFRNMVAVSMVAGIFLLTLVNIYLFHQTSALKANNKVLILQQDSIMSVHQNLSRELHEYSGETIPLVGENNPQDVSVRQSGITETN